ncbi:MAG: crotonase/enoyl-CoA hydratase family protein [Aliishimia sp.]
MTSINPDRIQITYENHIAHVQLTRVDKMNAVDQAMIDSIILAGQEVAASDARAVVISGLGKGFCAGIDIGALGAMAQQDPSKSLVPRTHGEGTTNQWQEVAMVWTRVPVPVIAALHGVCYGAGCQLALGADIRIAGADLKMAVMEMKWGIVPDMGGMVLLPKLARSDVIRKLTYTATPIGAEQARDWGLVTELAEDPLAAALDLAAEIALKSPTAIRVAKKLIDLAESNASEADVLMAESVEQAKLIGKPEQMEVIAAQFQKRAPNFG